MRFKELGIYNAKSEELTVTICIPELRISTSVLSSNTYNFNVHAISNKMESTESTLDHKLTNLRATGKSKDVLLNSIVCGKTETKEETHKEDISVLKSLLKSLFKS